MGEKIKQEKSIIRTIIGKDADGEVQELKFEVKKSANPVSINSVMFSGSGGEIPQFYYEGTVKADESNFAGWTFEGDVDFSGLKFKGFANFRESRFLGKADFFHCRFLEDVDFSNTRFEKTNVSEKKQHVNFSGCQFGRKEDTSDSKTDQQETTVNFLCAEFYNQGYVGFKGTQFFNNGKVVFNQISFQNEGEISFDHTNFENKGRLCFSITKFRNSGNVNFTFVKFFNSEWLELQSIYVLNEQHFNFINCSFRDGHIINFRQCVFGSKDGCNFSNRITSFKTQFRFSTCLFVRSKKVDFSHAQFHETVFEGGNFENVANWGNYNARSKEFKIFNKYIKKQLDKDGKYFCEVFDDSVKVDFLGIPSEAARNLTFRFTNLGGAKFDGLTLSHVQLNSPRWGEYNDRFALRQEVEIRNKNRKPTSQENRDISDQYTQLKVNLEKQGHYRQSGKFHYSEQELAREYAWENKKLIKWFAHSLYKWFSGYGEKPLRAIGWFFGLIILFSIWVAYLDTNFATLPYQGWDWFNRGFTKVLRTMFFLATPFKGNWYDDLGTDNIGQYIVRAFGQIMILAVQLPLMVIAIRRWFKR